MCVRVCWRVCVCVCGCMCENIVASLIRLRVYKEFHIRLVHISLTLDVLRQSPVTNRAADFLRALLSECLSLCEVPRRMWQTRVMVARVPRMLFVSLAVAPHAVFFLSKPIVLLALFCTLLICGCHDSFVLMVTPR